MRFDPEVFISYAHIDNKAAWGGVPWVSKFHEALDDRIEQLRGEAVGTFFDPSLQGNEVLTQALVDRLRNAGVFVPVLTPAYTKREWTRRELAEFCSWASQNGGVCIGDKSRIFVVTKTPIPRSEYPPELQDLIEYKFFTVEEGTDTPRELEIGDFSFKQKIDDIARHMNSLLDELEGLRGETVAEEKNVRTIYLAETTLDLQSQYEALRRDLEQAGQRVLPSRPLPVVSEKLERFVREQMAESDVSVHLFGSTYSFVPEGSKECVAGIQNRVAMERAATGGFSHLIWIAPGIKVDDERQSALLASLRANPQLQKGSDLLECPLEDLKTLIHSRVKQPVQPSATRAEDARKQIYLIYSRNDREAVSPWWDFLFNQGFEVLCPAFDGEEGEIRQLHEENLRSADAVAIFYGAGKDIWMQTTLRGLQRRKAEENARQLRAVAILTAPPETPEKRRFKTHLGLVIPQWQGFAPDAMADFLKLVNGG